jgi:Protein of unknown function (DUF3551)
MRLRIIFPLLVAGFASLAGPAQAQSAYDYPWCGLYADKSGATVCYYASFEQCRTTLQGIGGTCIRNPYYRGRPH